MSKDVCGCPDCYSTDLKVKIGVVMDLEGRVHKLGGVKQFDTRGMSIDEYKDVISITCTLCGRRGTAKEFGLNNQLYCLNDDKDSAQTK